MRTMALVLLLCGCAAAGPAPGPPPAGDAAAALAVVQRLFDGMRAGDAATVRSVFHPGTTLLTVTRREGAAVLESADVEGFATAVGAPRPEVWDERISDPVVLVDGDLATVWVDYAFFVGDRFSHCGVDAFGLIRGPDGWKIFQLVDTRRTEGC